MSRDDGLTAARPPQLCLMPSSSSQLVYHSLIQKHLQVQQRIPPSPQSNGGSVAGDKNTPEGRSCSGLHFPVRLLSVLLALLFGFQLPASGQEVQRQKSKGHCITFASTLCRFNVKRILPILQCAILTCVYSRRPLPVSLRGGDPQ